MGRCEGGAAVGREAGDAVSRVIGSGRKRSGRCGARGRRVRTLRTREALASRPPALRPAARSSTERWAARGGDEGAAATAPDRGLEHGPRRFPEARSKGFSRRRMWSAGRRLSPIARRKETPSHGVSGGLAGRSGSFARSRVCRRSAPLGGAEICNCEEGLPGADQRIRAMSHAWREAGRPAARWLFDS